MTRSTKTLSVTALELPPSPVPDHYRGVWRRSLLKTLDLRDTDTTVFWLQTARWHADIRLPAVRPDFSGVRGFADCNQQQLDWLIQQNGFAGITEVNVEKSREICRWHRLLDYQPEHLEPDAGRMEFSTALLTETGLYSTYLEHWRRLPDSLDGFAALQLMVSTDAVSVPTELMLIAGAYVMHVRDRAVEWPAELKPGTLLTTQAVSSDFALLNFELSFGRRNANGWEILHSTLPWREGQSVSVQLGESQYDRVAITVDCVLQQWKMMEWSPPLQKTGSR